MAQRDATDLDVPSSSAFGAYLADANRALERLASEHQRMQDEASRWDEPAELSDSEVFSVHSGPPTELDTDWESDAVYSVVVPRSDDTLVPALHDSAPASLHPSNIYAAVLDGDAAPESEVRGPMASGTYEREDRHDSLDPLDDFMVA